MGAFAPPTGRPRALSAFASRDFRLLWGGQAVSFIGDAAFLVAIGWRVTTMTGSAGSLGFVLALNSAATTMLTELVPEGYLARVVSLDFFGSFGLTPVGYALVGAIAGLFTPAQIIAVGGALGFLLWLMPLSFRSVRAAA